MIEQSILLHVQQSIYYTSSCGQSICNLNLILYPINPCRTRARVAMLRFLLTLVLGLQLAIDQCHGSGFAELCRKQYCRADAAKNGPSMGSTEYAAFSCSDCSPGTMYDPHVCKQPILHSSSSSNQVTEWSNDQMTGWQDDRKLRRRLTVWYILQCTNSSQAVDC